jgi:hypothetical protein
VNLLLGFLSQSYAVPLPRSYIMTPGALDLTRIDEHLDLDLYANEIDYGSDAKALLLRTAKEMLSADKILHHEEVRVAGLGQTLPLPPKSIDPNEVIAVNKAAAFNIKSALWSAQSL